MGFIRRRKDEGQHDYDLEQVKSIASQARRLAIYDPATGLFAYWYLQLRAAAEISRSRRHHKMVICLSIWAPTQSGIEGMSAALEKHLRDHDLAAYLHNGHFVVLLTETDEAGASITLERLLGACHGASGAIACFPGDGESLDELLEVAKARGAAQTDVA